MGAAGRRPVDRRHDLHLLPRHRGIGQLPEGAAVHRDRPAAGHVGHGPGPGVRQPSAARIAAPEPGLAAALAPAGLGVRVRDRLDAVHLLGLGHRFVGERGDGGQVPHPRPGGDHLDGPAAGHLRGGDHLRAGVRRHRRQGRRADESGPPVRRAVGHRRRDLRLVGARHRAVPPPDPDGAQLGGRVDPDHDPADRAHDAVDGGLRSPARVLRQDQPEVPDADGLDGGDGRDLDRPVHPAELHLRRQPDRRRGHRDRAVHRLLLRADRVRLRLALPGHADQQRAEPVDARHPAGAGRADHVRGRLLQPAERLGRVQQLHHVDGAGPALAGRRHLHHRRAGRAGRPGRLCLHAGHGPGLLPPGDAHPDQPGAGLQPGAVSGGHNMAATAWPVRSGAVPARAEGFSDRPETALDLAVALPAGAAVALVPDRAAAPAAFPGLRAGPAGQDWRRSSGKTQLAAAFAESLWQSGAVDLLVWIDATSRASVLCGYAAATAAATGRDRASSCESVAAQFLSWLGETSRSWLVVLDDLADPADLDGLWPTGPAGRVLMTAADPVVIPAGVRAVPVGPFSVREAISYLNGRLAADPDKRLGAIELAHDLDLEPVALAQASREIASSPLSCGEYRAHFVRRREQVAGASGVRPSAAAVTWMFLFGRADQLSPDGSAKLLLALAAMLDGHGIPQPVLTAAAAGAFLPAGNVPAGSVLTGTAPAGSERAVAALTALEQAGLLTVDRKLTPPAVRVSPVLQAALRAAMPEGMPEQAARAAADALLQA